MKTFFFICIAIVITVPALNAQDWIDRDKYKELNYKLQVIDMKYDSLSDKLLVLTKGKFYRIDPESGTIASFNNVDADFISSDCKTLCKNVVFKDTIDYNIYEYLSSLIISASNFKKIDSIYYDVVVYSIYLFSRSRSYCTSLDYNSTSKKLYVTHNVDSYYLNAQAQRYYYESSLITVDADRRKSIFSPASKYLPFKDGFLILFNYAKDYNDDMGDFYENIKENGLYSIDEFKKKNDIYYAKSYVSSNDFDTDIDFESLNTFTFTDSRYINAFGDSLNLYQWDLQDSSFNSITRLKYQIKNSENTFDDNLLLTSGDNGINFFNRKTREFEYCVAPGLKFEIVNHKEASKEFFAYTNEGIISFGQYFSKKFHLINPADNALDVSIDDSFKWSSASYSSHYELQISTDENFTNSNDLIVNDTVQELKFLPLKWKSDQKYYWRVIAFNNADTIAVSDTWSFSTEKNLCYFKIGFPLSDAKDVELEPEIMWEWECEGAYVTTDIMIYEGGRDSLLSNPNGNYPFSYKVPQGLLKENTKYLFDIGIVTNKNQVRGEVEFTTGKFSDIQDKSSNKQIAVFPQPVFSGDLLTIDVEEGEGASLKLYNLMGIELNVGVQRDGDKLRIQTAGLAPGVYILEVGGVRKKVVVM